MVGLLIWLAGCATVERTRTPEAPFADPSLEIADDDLAALRAVPRELGLAARDEAGTCAAIHAALAGEAALDRVLAANPDPADRPALVDLAGRVRGLTADLATDGAPASHVDWSALAAAAGPRAGAVTTWGAWIGERPPWGEHDCARPESVAPWLVRMRTAQRVACLREAFAPLAIRRWEALVDRACWCTTSAARVERLADLGRTLDGFAPGAGRIDDSLGFVTARPPRLDPTACGDAGPAR